MLNIKSDVKIAASHVVLGQTQTDNSVKLRHITIYEVVIRHNS